MRDWNDEVKAGVERKEVVWKDVLEAKDENMKERCIEIYKEEKTRVKSCLYQSKMYTNEQFPWKISQNVMEGNGESEWWKGGKL